jgi:hypothetical protein
MEIVLIGRQMDPLECIGKKLVYLEKEEEIE